jgi:hypothetical protein
LITGNFTQLFEGDRLTRAALGFGMGKTETRARVYFYDLSQNHDGRLRPFYRFRTTGGSGAMPGAVPSLGFGVLGPGAGTAGGLLEIPEAVNYAGQGLKLLPGLRNDVKRTARMVNGAFQDYLVARRWLEPEKQLTHPKRVGQPAGGIFVEP